MVNGVFNFYHSPGGRIVPYVLVGVGSATLDFPLSNESDSGRAYQVAGGSRFFFGERDKVAFRLEIGQIVAEVFDETTRHSNVIVGFTWRLGA